VYSWSHPFLWPFFKVAVNQSISYSLGCPGLPLTPQVLGLRVWGTILGIFFFFFLIFESGFLCVALAVLEPTLWIRLALNSKIHLPLSDSQCWYQRHVPSLPALKYFSILYPLPISPVSFMVGNSCDFSENGGVGGVSEWLQLSEIILWKFPKTS
jgi:hypothetical protein